MHIADTMTLDASGLTLTKDGYLVGEARAARAGNVQRYYGSELGLTGDDGRKVFGVYRDPDVVFDEASMLSLAGRPVTRGHPQDAVTAENWKDLARGQVGGVIRRDGEHVVAPMAIMDQAAAKEVAEGARALSAGYTVDIVADEGISPDGTPYQFRQAGALRFNHVAYLPDNNPRAGNTRIGDGATTWGASPIHLADEEEPDMPDNLRSVLVDGLSVSCTDQSAQAIEKLLSDRKAAQDALASAQADHTKALAAKDADLAKKDAEIDDLKGKQLSAADLDKLVADRAALVTVARAIVPDVKTDGLADADIRKAVVVAKLDDAAVKDKTAAYIDARFDILAEAAGKKSDVVGDVLKDGLSTQVADKDVSDARAEYLASFSGQAKAA